MQISYAAVDTAVLAFLNWKAGRGLVDAQAVHHILSLFADLEFEPTDVLLEDLENEVELSSDGDRSFGLYSLGLAKLRIQSSTRFENGMVRLRMSRTELALKVQNTPFAVDLLERLLICEALILSQHSSDDAREEVRRHLLLLKPDIESHYTLHDQSYPLLLMGLLQPNATDVRQELVGAFYRLVEQISGETAPLWYGPSLPNNCFVVLNAMRATELIGPELSTAFLQGSITRLRALAHDRVRFFSESGLRPGTFPVLSLPELLPYVRVLLTQDPSDGLLRRNLRTHAQTAYTRMLEENYSRSLHERERVEELGNEVRNVIGRSLVLDSTFTQLAGGLSGSEVYTAGINIIEPFAVSGQTLVFKLAEGAAHGQELRNFEAIRHLGMQTSFAAIRSQPVTVKIGQVFPSILLYEHLTNFLTLRQMLQDQMPQTRKIELLRAICNKLYKSVYSAPQLQMSGPCLVWARVRDRIASVSASLSLLKHPIFSTSIRDSHRRTMVVLDAWSLDHLRTVPFMRSIMHGDLNCRNIMVRILRENLADVKLIDYETLDVSGDYLIDIGELIEDAVMSCDYVTDLDAIEMAITDELVAPNESLRTEPALRERLLLARLRSLVFIVRYRLMSADEESTRSVDRALKRWGRLLNECEQESSCVSS